MSQFVYNFFSNFWFRFVVSSLFSFFLLLYSYLLFLLSIASTTGTHTCKNYVLTHSANSRWKKTQKIWRILPGGICGTNMNLWFIKHVFLLFSRMCETSYVQNDNNRIPDALWSLAEIAFVPQQNNEWILLSQKRNLCFSVANWRSLCHVQTF